MSSVHYGNEACGDSGTFSARMQDTRICGTRHPGDPLSVMRAGAANLRETPRRPTIFAWVRKVIRELMAPRSSLRRFVVRVVRNRRIVWEAAFDTNSTTPCAPLRTQREGGSSSW